jgi:serine/threonine-protein kinase RsbW
MNQITPIRIKACHVIPFADNMAVRQGLQHLFSQEPLIGISEDARSTAELVLAEALNNIVEHAYAAQEGAIEIAIEMGDDGLDCMIVDHGAPMPGHALPQGKPQDLSNLDDLPEGGFGWFLIRSIALDLNYQRVQGQNHLRFRLPAHALVA